jgi:hypothetical protein
MAVDSYQCKYLPYSTLVPLRRRHHQSLEGWQDSSCLAPDLAGQGDHWPSNLTAAPASLLRLRSELACGPRAANVLPTSSGVKHSAWSGSMVPRFRDGIPIP